MNCCYFCKIELYGICMNKVEELNIFWVVDGCNVDDLSDH